MTVRLLVLWVVCFATFSRSANVYQPPKGSATNVYQAIAILTPAISTEPSLIGNVTFSYDISTNTTTVVVSVSGIQTNPTGLHGIHIHGFGDLRGLFPSAGVNVSGGLSAGAHFAIGTNSHGCPDENSTSWHVGDMGNWQAVDGVINQTKLFSSQFSLIKYAANSVIGRAVVVHETVDDCVNVLSAGKRLAYGVIGIANVPATEINIAGASADITQATCVFQGTINCTGNCLIGQVGSALLVNSDTAVTISAEILGLSSERGFHIHEFGDLSVNSGNSAGGHYNPMNISHGLPPSDSRHMGDLGSINAFMLGNGYYEFTPAFSSFNYNLSEFVGRALLVHQWLDHGLDPSCSSYSGFSTGTAGARIYWCVIGIAYTPNQSVPGNFLPVPTLPTEITFPESWVQVPCTVMGNSNRNMYSVVWFLCGLIIFVLS